MKKVFYKGEAYEYEVREVAGKRQYFLSQDGILKHTVEQGELDIKSIVSLILDSYYRTNQGRVSTNQAA